MELESSKKKKEFESLFSKPPPISPSLLGHSLNIPPPRFAKAVEPPMKNQLSDLEKQMQAMASEISRLKHFSGADKFTNGNH
jgi:hypothetical protein